MSYMIDDYTEWLSSKKRKNGTEYSKETISNYIKSLQKDASKLIDISLPYTDMFYCDDIIEFDNIYNSIVQSQYYMEINNSYHRIFQSSLNSYRNFLTAKVKNVHESKVSFEEWLRNYPNHKYVDNTIKRYIRALENAEKWFGISIGKSILNIVDTKEFKNTYEKIKALPDFDLINQNHGHGDFSAAMTRYEEYLMEIFDNVEWWPSLEEYHPGITKDQWLALLKNPEIIGPIWGGVLAMFYAIGGVATCTKLGEKYNQDPASIRASSTQLAIAIQKATNCPTVKDNDKDRYWPILFVGRKASTDEKGSWVWKLRDELYDAISESDILKYLPETMGKSWLLTWNPVNYEYTEYEDKRQDVLNGIKYVDQWACNNTHVSIGDRVYLMRIGVGKQNGIVASGHAVRTSYLAPHYDPERAAEGEQIKKIDVQFDCLLDRNGSDFLKQSELNELFPNQQWSPQGSGIEIKEEYKESLEEEWRKYMNNEQREEEEVMEISVKEAIAQIKNYIASRGFTYDGGLIENFYLSLKSKPFVILAGTSGTGKTRLVRLFAQAINAEYKMVPVRPDWSDSSDLFGHVDLNGNFIPGVILEFIADAYKHPNKPYILCLDEMNLARVEYYLSDFLSVIETRDFVGEGIVSDPLVSLEKYGSDTEARNKYGEIGFPPNLYLVGTVNMDETTFPFSKKVLDRANTIEFNYVDLIPDDNEFPETEKLSVPNSFLKTKYLLLAQCNEDKDYIKKLSEELQKLNLILQKANAHVGYRVRDEIAFYMLNNKETELISEDDAFDNEIMQKILPRIQGSSTAVKEMLCELFKEFAGDYTGIQVSSNDTASDMLKKIEKDGARYRKSAEKIAFMVRRFEEDGFTSYWL